MTRTMAKSFEVELAEKGSPLQTKINAFTKDKNIADVHDFAVSLSGNTLRGVLLYEQGPEDGDAHGRILSKVVQAPLGSETQTKVNAFTKDKELEVLDASTAIEDGQAVVAILYRKGEGDEDEAPASE